MRLFCTLLFLIGHICGALLCAAIANDLVQDKEEIKKNWKFVITGEANSSLQYQSRTPERSGAKLEQSFVTLGLEWKQKIRAVVTSKLEHIFKQNYAINDQFNVAQFVREAFIEIREIGNKPVAIIIGKHPIAFGQDMRNMPIFSNNPLFTEQNIQEVIGLTIDFDFSLWELFDKLEVSVFETKKSDLEIGRIDGMSVRLSRLLFANWMATISHAELGNNHLDTGHERRSSVGFVGQTRTGTMVGWFEGIYFSNNPRYPKAMFGLTIGSSIRAFKSNEVVVEFNWIENHVMDLGIGWVSYFFKSFKVGAEVRYRSTVERDNGEIILGMNFSYIFGNEKQAFYPRYLFGNKDQDDEGARAQRQEDLDEDSPGEDIPTIGDIGPVQNLENKSKEKVFSQKSDYKQIVAYFNNKKIFYHDIANFLENSKMTDAAKISLYKEAQGSFPKYLELKEDWVNKRFSQGIKQFLYYKIIETEALKSKSSAKKPFNPFSSKNETTTGRFKFPSFGSNSSKDEEGEKRQGFLVTQDIYQKLLNETENNVLKELLDKKIGITNARMQFGKFLIAQNYPHKYEEKSIDVYERWYRSMSLRIYEELREREVSKFEVMTSSAHLQGLIKVYESDANLYFQNLVSKVKKDFNSSNLSEDEVSKIMENNPEYQIAVSELREKSLENTPLNAFKTEGVFSKKEQLAQELIKNITDLKLEKEAKFYINLAFRYSKKYTAHDLEDSRAEALKKYQESSEIHFLTLSRVYGMSEALIQNNISDEAKLESDVLGPLQNSFTSFRERVLNDQCFDKILYNCLIEKFVINQDNGANESIGQFSKWFISQAILSDLTKDEAQFQAIYQKYDGNLQKKLISYLLEKKYQKLVTSYRRKLAKNYLGQIRFLPKLEGQFIYESQAIRRLFE